MRFDLAYDASTSVIRASGRDNAGAFSIIGFFDGRNLRWIKRYPTWHWKYAGKVLQRHGEDYCVTGGWGDQSGQYGVFLLYLSLPGSTRNAINGEWSGVHVDSANSPFNGMERVPLVLTYSDEKLYGEGRDNTGHFLLDGTAVYDHVYFSKRYDDGSTWTYDGQLSADKKSILGMCFAGSDPCGTMSFTKGRGVAQEQAMALMPTIAERWGPLQGACTCTGIVQDELDYLCKGFTMLRY